MTTDNERAWLDALRCASCRARSHTADVHSLTHTMGHHRLMTEITDTTTPPPVPDVDAWIFTFGQGYNLKDNYVRVTEPDKDRARAVFVEARRHVGEFDDTEARWAWQYPDNDDTRKMIKMFRLTEVDISTPIRYL